MNEERLMKILLSPYNSEKTAIMADKYKHIAFKVIKDATKPEIKAAVEHLFKVKVDRVTVDNVRGKVRNFKQRKGKLKDWKKAYVALKEGFDIDFVNT